MKTKKNGAPMITEAEIDPYLVSLRAVSNFFDDSLYVVDFKRRIFHFVSENGIFLCDRSPKEVLNLGYAYYPKLIHQEDYQMAKRIHKEIVRYFSHPASLNDLIFVKFSLRLHKDSGLMMQHKVTPVIVDNQARLAICTVNYTKDKPGNLYAYHRNTDVYYRYSLKSGRWKQEPVINLKLREKKILELSKAGITRKEIADLLGISLNTLRNNETVIYNKLNVRTREQAGRFASDNRLIFVPDQNNNNKEPVKLPNGKRARRTMTPEKLLRIQKALNDGQSINSIAKQENVSEFTIRYAIDKGKLKKML